MERRFKACTSYVSGLAEGAAFETDSQEDCARAGGAQLRVESSGRATGVVRQGRRSELLAWRRAVRRATVSMRPVNAASASL